MTKKRAVIDTNVVFEGLTRKGGACGFLIDAWRAGIFTACISNALAYEYDDVLGGRFSKDRWREIKPLLGKLVGDHTEFVTIRFSWRPSSPDPGDDHIIDCAMNARAIVVTSNIRDFKTAMAELGLRVMKPGDFLKSLVESELS